VAERVKREVELMDLAEQEDVLKEEERRVDILENEWREKGSRIIGEKAKLRADMGKACSPVCHETVADQISVTGSDSCNV
jgi:hypothetical protein